MTNNNPYDRVTERILDLMQKGVCPWRQPWSTRIEPPQNFATGRHYSGMNFFMLSMSGYQSPYFLTFRQIQERGGCVKKGSHGFPIVYWSTTEVEGKGVQPSESAELPASNTPNIPKSKLIPFLRSYVVFNAEQIENVAFPAPPTERDEAFKPLLEAEDIFARWRDAPEIVHGCSRAYYKPSEDKIFMPFMSDFERREDYYCTRFHEMGHATGASKRLNRSMGGRYGSQEYSREELVAEMTSAFLCAKCGIDSAVIEAQASYISGWMKAISDDHRLVVLAAGQAQRAANYIQGITYEIPTVEKAQQLARSMEVKEMAREVARELHPDNVKTGVEMTMTMD
jgi:antirestriction protein ArdC